MKQQNCLEHLFLIKAYDNLSKQCDKEGVITRLKARKAISYTRLDKKGIDRIINLLISQNLLQTENKKNLKILNKKNLTVTNESSNICPGKFR